MWALPGNAFRISVCSGGERTATAQKSPDVEVVQASAVLITVGESAARFVAACDLLDVVSAVLVCPEVVLATIHRVVA